MTQLDTTNSELLTHGPTIRPHAQQATVVKISILYDSTAAVPLERTYPYQPPRKHIVSAIVRALMDADDVESVNSAMTAARQKLRAGDHTVALELNNVALGAYDLDDRALALETIAGARIQAFERLVTRLIAELCASGNGRLQVSAVAAATHLSAEGKRAVRDAVERLVKSDSDSRVRRAANAFLRG